MGGSGNSSRSAARRNQGSLPTVPEVGGPGYSQANCVGLDTTARNRRSGTSAKVGLISPCCTVGKNCASDRTTLGGATTQRDRELVGYHSNTGNNAGGSPSSISIHRVEDHEGWIRNHWVRIKRADGGDGTTCPIGMYRGHAPTVNRGEQRGDDGLQIIDVESDEQGDFQLAGGNLLPIDLFTVMKVTPASSPCLPLENTSP